MITPIRGRKLTRQAIKTVTVINIRNDNPDKGTETRSGSLHRVALPPSLEMITPIRGRKHQLGFENLRVTVIRNDNPDKGTETVSAERM